jgi:hypothetical protein
MMSATVTPTPQPEGKRVAKTKRNLDDSLKLFNFITLRSAGGVLVFFGGSLALFGSGPRGFFAHKIATLAVALIFHWIEKHEDEWYIPSAISFYRNRHWRVIYSAAHETGGRSLEELFDGHSR